MPTPLTPAAQAALMARICATGIPADVTEIEAQMREILEQRDSLARFKAYVHKRLDDAGIPVDPESPHKAEGCRIGGRLDELLGQREALLEACSFLVADKECSCITARCMAEIGVAVTACDFCIATNAIARTKGHQSDLHHAHI